MATTDTNENAIDALHSLNFFRDLTPRQLEVATSLVTFETKDENEILMRTAAPGRIVYFILAGYVKICTPRDHDTDLILGLRGAGELLGDMSVVDAQEKSATVITHTACELGWISYENFWGILWEFSPIPYNLAHLLNERIRRLNGAMNVLAPRASELRLARQLLLLCRDFGQETPNDDLVVLPFALAATDLAGLTAVPLPEITALLHDWQQKGFIGTTSGSDSPFIIRKVASLQAIAG